MCVCCSKKVEEAAGLKQKHLFKTFQFLCRSVFSCISYLFSLILIFLLSEQWKLSHGRGGGLRTVPTWLRPPQLLPSLLLTEQVGDGGGRFVLTLCLGDFFYFLSKSVCNEQIDSYLCLFYLFPTVIMDNILICLSSFQQRHSNYLK